MNGDELQRVTELAAPRGSGFVFAFPDIIRALLARGEDFSVVAAVRERLWFSACGGGRSYTNHELDPEYRHILEQGDAMANRYRDDPLLGPFYRMVADSERRHIQAFKRAVRDEEEWD